MSPIEEIHFQRCWRAGWPPMPHRGDRIRITKATTTDLLRPGDEVFVDHVWLAMDEVCVEIRMPGNTTTPLWACFGDRWEEIG